MLLVGIPGLEPGMTGPESVVLPLHHIPLFCYFVVAMSFLNCECKGNAFFLTNKIFLHFFFKKRLFFHSHAILALKRPYYRATNLKKTEKLVESTAYSFFCTIFVVE